MTPEKIIDYCLSKEGAYIAFPFGPCPICVKVGNRIFLELYPEEDNPKITVCCEPLFAVILRQNNPGVIEPGYHCPPQIRHCKNTIYYAQIKSDSFILSMIDESYHYVIKRIRK